MPRPSVRDKVVDSAVIEFQRRGFNACSVEDITSAAGVPKGSFYNHFKSKEELGAEVVRTYASRSRWRAEVDQTRPPLAQLRAKFEAVAARLAEKEYLGGCLFANMGAELADHSPAVRSEVGASLDRWSNDTADLIRAAQAAGDLPADRDADRLGRFVVDAWEGAVTRSKIGQGPQPLSDFFAVVFDQLLT